MIPTERFTQVPVDSETALWDWLATNHARAEGVWLVTWKKADPTRHIAKEAVLDALTAWGWTDGLMRKLDETRVMQLISPRKSGVWAETYQRRAARLIAQGRMQPPGLAALQAATAAGTRDALAHVDRLEVPDDLAQALGDQVAQAFAALAPSYRRNLLRWLALAKVPATRARRVAAILASLRTGARIPNM
jgi:uncharacterized protein YdeI (YjbR/CyaY-like superfamily)